MKRDPAKQQRLRSGVQCFSYGYSLIGQYSSSRSVKGASITFKPCGDAVNFCNRSLHGDVPSARVRSLLNIGGPHLLKLGARVIRSHISRGHIELGQHAAQRVVPEKIQCMHGERQKKCIEPKRKESGKFVECQVSWRSAAHVSSTSSPGMSGSAARKGSTGPTLPRRPMSAAG